jgi:dihydrofolate reductase
VTAGAGIIVAMTKERLIGRDNDLPWHWSEDLKHFKATTRGQTVLMGRRSFDSLGGKPLPKRTNLVVSRSLGAEAGAAGLEMNGVRVFGSLAGACAWVTREQSGGAENLWVLGGSTIFREFLEPLDGEPGSHASLGLLLPRRLVVTWVPSVPVLSDDVLFPFDERWIDRHYEATERRLGETGELEFVTYVLRDRASLT